MRRVAVNRFFAALLMVGLLPLTAFAGDAAAGEAKAEACAACHGAGGNAPIANYPKLAGQDEKYLLHTLKTYKSGARNNALMAGQMAGLSAQDLADLAAYFAAQPGELEY